MTSITSFLCSLFNGSELNQVLKEMEFRLKKIAGRLFNAGISQKILEAHQKKQITGQKSAEDQTEKCGTEK
jgi:hypothetical protein